MGLIGGLTACSEPEAPAAEEPPPVPDVLYFEPIGQGQYAAYTDTTTRVIRDSLQWLAYADTLRPLAPFKPVDFNQAMVLLAAVPVESGGHSIQFEGVEQEPGGGVLAQYVINEPDGECITPTATATPFQAILVRRADGPVRFEYRVEPFTCGLSQ